MKMQIGMTYNYQEYRGEELAPEQKDVIKGAQKIALQLYDWTMSDNESEMKEYLNGYSDITFMVSKSKQLDGLRVWLSKKAYVDTFSQEVYTRNGQEEAFCFLPENVCNYINSTFGVSEYSKVN